MTIKIILENFWIFVFLAVVSMPQVHAANLNRSNDVQYRSYFGSCPSRLAGTLTITLLKEFEKTNSLKLVKEKMISENLAERHFISDYKIDYDPSVKNLTFSYNCPAPLMKVQIYKENGIESYTAILVEGGLLYDPTYEVVLKEENKIKNELPFLALPVGEIDKNLQVIVAKLFSDIKPELRQKLSEVIVNKENSMTVILSIDGRPSSVFLGNDQWENKLVKLQKILDHLESKNKIPSIINLTNTKKVVVKFPGKF